MNAEQSSRVSPSTWSPQSPLSRVDRGDVFGLRSRITRRLILLALALGLTGSVVFGIWHVSRELSELKGVTQKHLLEIGRAFAPTIAKELEAGQLEIVKSQFSGLLGVPTVDGIQLSLFGGQVLDAGINYDPESTVAAQLPLVTLDGSDEKTIGVLRVYADAAVLRNQVLSSEARDIAAHAAIFVIVALIMAGVYQRAFIRRLNKITSYTRSISPSDLVLGRPSENDDGQTEVRRDELDDLTDSVAHLRRSASEAALEMSVAQLRYAEAAKLAKLGHWIYDTRAEKYIECSDELARIHGSTRGAFMAAISGIDTIAMTAHPDDRERYEAHVVDCIRNGNAFSLEYRLQNPDGEVKWVRETAEPILDDDGTVIRTRGTVQDITDRKIAELQLIQSSKMASLGEMAIGIAHELNQPLNIIQMSVDSLAEVVHEGKDCRPLIERKLTQVSDQVARASKIINHMRTFGRGADDNIGTISVNRVVTGATQFLQDQLKATGIELRVHVDGADCTVSGNEGQFEQVIINLVNNAKDAIISRREAEPDCLRPDEVVIDVAPAQNRTVSVAVRDTGTGIPEGILDTIFDPFVTTKDVGEGTGIGLSISYGIVNNMGGTLVAGNTGDGAEFHITLPFSEGKPA